MISPENFVFNEVATDLRATYMGISVSGEYSEAKAFEKSSMAASIVEIDNAVLQKMSTTTIENAVVLGYEVNAYSNRVGFGKSETKKVIATVDAAFARLGFTRTTCYPMTNLQDNKIYRMVARYTGVCDKNYTIYTK